MDKLKRIVQVHIIIVAKVHINVEFLLCFVDKKAFKSYSTTDTFIMYHCNYLCIFAVYILRVDKWIKKPLKHILALPMKETISLSQIGIL